MSCGMSPILWEASPTPMGAATMSNKPFVRGQSSDLRRGRVSEDFACYSVTKVVNNRLPILATDSIARILIDSWQFLRTQQRMKLFAFCIMPEHFHLVFCLMPGTPLSKLMEDTGKFTSREMNKLLQRRGTFWQEGFHDHRCRDELELHELCLYIEHNPVRKKLVTSPELWPYSSASAGNKHLVDREWWP